MGLRALHKNVIQYTSNSCPPIVGKDFITAKYCSATNSFVLDEIERIKPDEIVLSAYWYSYGNRISLLSETLNLVRKRSPNSRVVIVGNVPLWPGRLPFLMLKHNITLEGLKYVKLNSYGSLKSLDKSLEILASANDSVFFSALDTFCINETCQATTMINGIAELTTMDYGHLTSAGSLQLAGKLLDSIGSARNIAIR